jgi:hypothetical protein
MTFALAQQTTGRYSSKFSAWGVRANEMGLNSACSLSG